MPITPEIINAVAEASKCSRNYAFDIALAIVPAIVAVLFERWFGLSEKVIKKGIIKQKFNTIFNGRVIQIGWKNVSHFFGGKNDIEGNILPESLSVIPEMNQPQYDGPLSLQQQEICKRIKEISNKHSQAYDSLKHWEDAKRKENLGEAVLAVGIYLPLFRKIISVLEVVAIENGANDEVSNLIALVNGLEQSLSNKSDNGQIKKQIGDCENTVFLLLAKLPL